MVYPPKKSFSFFYLNSIIIFIIGNMFQFQNYHRHNIFLFYPCWFLLSSIIIFLILKTIGSKIQDEENQGVFIGFCIVFLFISCCSSGIGYYRLHKSTFEYQNELNANVSKWIAKNTPIKAVFLGNFDNYNVVNGAGRVLYLGHPQKMWDFGFEDQERVSDVNNFLKDLNNNTKLPKVKYIVHQEGVDSNKFFVKTSSGSWKDVFSEKKYWIYERVFPI